MASRITLKYLRARLSIAVKILQDLGYPVHEDYSAPWPAGCLQVGHNGCGYSVTITTRDGCTGENTLLESSSGKECCEFISGMMAVERIAFLLRRSSAA
jgi:hypothetical protein